MKKNISAKKYKRPIIGLIIAAAIVIYTLTLNGKVLYFTFGLSKNEVMRVGSIEISSAAANILISDEKTRLIDLSDDRVLSDTVKGESIESYVKTSVKNRLSRVAALNEMAKTKGVVLSHTEKENAGKAASEFYNALSDSDRAYTGASVEDLEKMYTQFAIAQKMKKELTAGSTIEVSTDEARVISIQFICADAEEKINDAKKELAKGTPFYNVAQSVNGSNEYTAELTRGQTDSEFENTAFSLTSGQVSNVIASNGKYYIIKCSSDNEQSKTDSNKVKLTAEKENKYFESKFLPFENSLYVEMNNGVWKKKSVAGAGRLSAHFDDYYNKFLDL